MSSEDVNKKNETNLDEENVNQSGGVEEYGNEKIKARKLLKGMVEIAKISSTELVRKVLTREPLFKNVYQSDSFTDLMPDEAAEKRATVLLTGFGLRSLHQLQEALKAEEIIKSKKTEAEMFPCVCSDGSSEKSTPPISQEPPKYSIEERVQYMLQLEKYMEVEGEMGSVSLPLIEKEEVPEKKRESASLPAMEKAKYYLREHKIFQFFQFLMSHLLSACPEDPIDYILALLDRILLYRNRLISPPLLYEKKHIEQLFNLMDRFGQGSVDMHQYRTAMETFGICSFNERPILNLHNMVSKEVFVEEIFTSELTMFDDLIRSRDTCTCDLAAPPPTIVDLDLKAQSTTSGDDSVSDVEFPQVVSVSKFWEKHGSKQPKVYKGKFWREFSKEIQVRRDSASSDRRSSERRDSGRSDSERRDSERSDSKLRNSWRKDNKRRDSGSRKNERRYSGTSDTVKRESERRYSETRKDTRKDDENESKIVKSENKNKGGGRSASGRSGSERRQVNESEPQSEEGTGRRRDSRIKDNERRDSEEIENGEKRITKNEIEKVGIVEEK